MEKRLLPIQRADAMSNKRASQTACAQILGYGGAFIDVVYRVPEEFVASLRGAKGGAYNCTYEEQEAIIASLSEECRASRDVRAGGGIGNTLTQIAGNGGKLLRPLMCGVVGEDEEGYRFIGELESHGVDVKRVKMVSGAHTGRCLSLLTPDGERTMYTFQGVNADLGRHLPLKKTDFNGITAFYTEGYMLIDEPMMRRTLEIARRIESMEIHFDVGSVGVVMAYQEFMKGFLPSHVDFLYANYDEASALTGASIPQDIIELLATEISCPLVKLGKDGSIYFDRENAESVQVPCMEPPLENGFDSTGAGDAWAGGFIWAHLAMGSSLDECVVWANEGAYNLLKSRKEIPVLADADRHE